MRGERERGREREREQTDFKGQLEASFFLPIFCFELSSGVANLKSDDTNNSSNNSSRSNSNSKNNSN